MYDIINNNKENNLLIIYSPEALNASCGIFRNELLKSGKFYCLYLRPLSYNSSHFVYPLSLSLFHSNTFFLSGNTEKRH